MHAAVQTRRQSVNDNYIENIQIKKITIKIDHHILVSSISVLVVEIYII